MNAATKRILVIIIALAIIIPSVYYAYTIYVKGTAEQDPVSFVPYNSSMVVRYNSPNGTLYAFASNNSYGIITTLSLGGFVPTFNNTTSTGTGNTSLNVSLAGDYQGVQIFRISNVTLSGSFLSAITEAMGLNKSLASMIAFIPGINLTTLTIYFANPSAGILAAGSLKGVQDAVSAHTSGQTFAPKESIHLNAASNISFYYEPSNTSVIQHISGNLTYNTTHLFIKVLNQSAAQKVVLLLQMENLSGLSVQYAANSLLEISINIGYYSILQALSPVIGNLGNSTAFNGVKL